jgi:hypothetical protein
MNTALVGRIVKSEVKVQNYGLSADEAERKPDTEPK